MSLLERYIFKTAVSAFTLCLCALTGVIWVSTALRELDLVSGKGQTIFVFLKVTLLTLPALVMIIAPIALFAGVLYTLNKLNGDSELIVMNAAGMAPFSVAKPLGLLTIFVAVLVGYITIFAMPESFRTLRDMLTKIRADVVTKFLQEGRFTTLDKGITFHYREKGPNGIMLGVLIHDGREPSKSSTYLAERGQIVENAGSSYIILEQGSVHRQQDSSKENAIIAYDRYAIDLDQFGADGDKTVYKPRERTTPELLNVDPKDIYFQLQPGRFRTELHERFANPLYPFATMLIGFAALGGAKTTRQGRGTAIAGAVVAIVALRIGGFAASSLAGRSAIFTPLIYLVPVGAAIISGAMAMRSMMGAPVQSKLTGRLLAFGEDIFTRGRRMVRV
ncbi:MAG: LPS export ABC transporter permease LptF [Beijerinckiaceae bacterium]